MSAAPLAATWRAAATRCVRRDCRQSTSGVLAIDPDLSILCRGLADCCAAFPREHLFASSAEFDLVGRGRSHYENVDWQLSVRCRRRASYGSIRKLRNPLKPLDSFIVSGDTYRLRANCMPSDMQHFLVADMDGWIYVCWGTSFQGDTSGITIGRILKGKGQLPPREPT